MAKSWFGNGNGCLFYVFGTRYLDCKGLSARRLQFELLPPSSQTSASMTAEEHGV